LGKETKKRGLDVRKSGSVGQINKWDK
jgi:hypothetical protein